MDHNYVHLQDSVLMNARLHYNCLYNVLQWFVTTGWKGIQSVKTECWYSGGGDLTRDWHVLMSSSWHNCPIHHLMLQ